MIMNNQISLKTTGRLSGMRGIDFYDFESRNSGSICGQVHIGKMRVGDLTITIHFASHEEILEFCETHNIEYDDSELFMDDTHLVGQTFDPND